MEHLGPEMAEVEFELATATSHAEQLVDSMLLVCGKPFDAGRIKRPRRRK